MAQEIERKFLVQGEFKHLATNVIRISQGFLNSAPERTVRIRLAGDMAYITVKGKNSGASRFEWEQPIPLAEAQQLFALCEPGAIEKTRYHIPVGKHLFEVDEFHGDNQGLTLAEVELASPDEPVELPEWIGVEVTNDARYYNSMLSRHPFALWGKETTHR